MIIFKKVQKFILEDLDVCIPKGEVVGVIGASGAGKTTFLKLICGLLQPTRGEVYTFRTNPVRERGSLGNKMASLFADIPVFSEEGSIRQNFEELRYVYGMKKREFEQKYQSIGERLGFLEYENQSRGQLSLGQRRRAELGTVFFRDAELLVLDEPGIGLDLNAKEILRHLILEQKQRGTTVVLSSHDMEEIAETCDRVLLLDRGKVLFYGDRELLRKKYAPYTTCELEFEGVLPSLADLPITHYRIENNHLTITFHSNRISAAELMEALLSQTTVRKVNMKEGSLVDTLKNVIQGGKEEGDEFY